MKLRIQENELHYFLELLRSKTFEETGVSLNNVIQAMRKTRHDIICGECFDSLDFGSIILNDIYFSDDGEAPSTFNNCHFTEWNIHGGLIGRPWYWDFSDDSKSIVIVCNDGNAIIWDLKSKMMRKVVTVCEPFKLNSHDEELVDLTRPIVFNSENDEKIAVDIEQIKRTKLSEFFSKTKESSVRFENVENDAAILSIIQKFKEVNGDMFKKGCSNSSSVDELVIPFKIYSGDRLICQFEMKKEFHKEVLFSDANIRFLHFSDKGTYGILDYNGDCFLFEVASGQIISICKKQVVISNDERYYAERCHNGIKISALPNGEEILIIKRNVQKISSVDIDIESGQALSMSVGNDDFKIQPVFLWNLQHYRMFGKAFFNTMEVIEINIKHNPQFQNDELSLSEKYTLLCHIVTKNVLKQRENVIFDLTTDENFDSYIWEIHYARDESFCIVFEHNEFHCFFQFQDINGHTNYYDYDGKILCAVLIKNDEFLCFFTTHNTIYYWNTKNRKTEKKIDIELPSNLFVTAAQFSQDGSYLIVGTDSGEVLLLNSDNGKIIETLYHINSLHVENCSMNSISAGTTTKKIFYQNGAAIKD